MSKKNREKRDKVGLMDKAYGHIKGNVNGPGQFSLSARKARGTYIHGVGPFKHYKIH